MKLVSCEALQISVATIPNLYTSSRNTTHTTRTNGKSFGNFKQTYCPFG